MYRFFWARGVCAGIFSGSALLVLLIYPCGVVAQTAGQVSQVVVELPAQPLADTLRVIARQAGVSILFDPATVNGRISPAVSGRLTATEAIARALEGSGLLADWMKDGSVVVRAVSAVPAASAPSASTRPAELQKVDITGSRLARIAAEGPTPVNVYTRDDIDRSGQPTLERFLSSLNEVSSSQGEGSFGGTLGQSTVQLRGLPLGSTLVLINGRRVQAVGSSSADFFDLSLIPMAAIERVEIVPVGSSAVYGGDALAGVVNVILKKSLDGASLVASLGSGKRNGDSSLSLATGRSSDDGSFLVLGSYSRSTPLNTSELGFFRDGDYRRYGGSDVRTRDCTPGTVSSTSGANLPGLGASFAGIPAAGVGQALQVSDFAGTAGQANLCNPYAAGAGYPLIQGKETSGLHASGERRLGGSWALFGEVTAARERVWANQSGLTLDDVTVPASNPYNPFGQDVQVTSVLGPANGVQGYERRTNFARVLAGLRGDLGAGWDAEFTVSTTLDNGGSRSRNSAENDTALNAALSASSADAALNPFTTGRAASDQVLQGIWSDALRTSHGSRNQATAFVRGSAFQLPAGATEVVVGGEFSRDAYATAIPEVLDVRTSRRADAIFGELRAPLWRSYAGSGRAWDLAALTVAGRRDHYSDFGSAGTYQGGLEVRPARDLLLRASTATSFKPPTLLETNVQEADYPAALFGLTDPARNNVPIDSGEVVLGTNPSLKPEHGRANSLGAVWEPESSPGTRLALTAWRVKIDSVISIPFPQTVLDNETLFPGFIERGPSVNGQPGPVTRILYSYVNFGGIQTSGLDIDAVHTWRTALGRLTLGASATRATDYGVALAPGSPVQDRLGRRADDYWAPRWKGRTSAAFERDGWSVGITGRYLGSYLDEQPSDRRLGNYWMYDVAASVDLKKLGLSVGSTKKATLSAGIVNLLNRQPEFVSTAPYYDVTQADWRGRYASVRLAVDW